LTAPEPIAADCTSGVPPTTGIPGRDAEVPRDVLPEVAEHVGRADEIGELRAVDTEHPEETRVIVDLVEIAIVGDPVEHDRVVRGAHRPVSLRLSQSFGSRYFHVARRHRGARVGTRGCARSDPCPTRRARRRSA